MSVTIDTLLTKMEEEMAYLERRNEINVSMRIDETLEFLGDVKTDLLSIKGGQKFDLVETVGDNSTIVYTLNGNVITAGSNVLTYGDTLKITVTAETGYNINSFKINNVQFADGTDEVEYEFTVVTNIDVKTTAILNTYDLSITEDSKSSVVVTIDGEPITAGEDVLTYGDEIIVTASADTGYTIATLKLNGDDFVSGSTHSIVGAVSITATSIADTFDLSITSGTNSTITVMRGETELTAGTDVISYDDELVITVSADTGYSVTTLKVNDVDFTSGNTLNVTGNIAVESTATVNTYDLSITDDDNCTITVMRGENELTAGEDVLTYGDEITVTASADEGHQIASLQVNSADFISGNTHEVTGNVTIVATSESEG